MHDIIEWLPFGTSGRVPGWILSDAFHFFAEPAPQCCSNCVAVNSRRSGLSFAHVLQLHITRWSPRRNVP